MGLFHLASCDQQANDKKEVDISREIQSEDSDRFNKYIVENKIGLKQTETDQDSNIFETIYLGHLKVGSENLYVLSQFYSIQAAIVRHGNSRIIFLDQNGDTKRIYILSMPDELPTEIKNNKLKLGELYFDEFENGLPKLICVPQGGCYE